MGVFQHRSKSLLTPQESSEVATVILSGADQIRNAIIGVTTDSIRYCSRIIFSLAVDANYGTLLLLPCCYSCRCRFAL
jgi:hypothetical protein